MGLQANNLAGTTIGTDSAHIHRVCSALTGSPIRYYFASRKTTDGKKNCHLYEEASSITFAKSTDLTPTQPQESADQRFYAYA